MLLLFVDICIRLLIIANIMSYNSSIQKSILEHFTAICEPNNDGHYIVKCKYCDTKLKGYLKATTNCIRHIRTKHNYIIANGLTKFNTKAKVASKYSPNDSYNANDCRHMEITEALHRFIIEDLMPISIVDSTSFNYLVELLDSNLE